MAGLKKVKEDELESVVSSIEDEYTEELNDVVFGEDGYVHDEPLLAGYIDPETGIRHTTFTYREMNGKDEEAISKSDVRGNGGKLANVLVERCVSEIGTLSKKELGIKKWGEIIRSLYGGDIDYIILKIREISKGKEVEFSHKCPECKTNLTTIINTDEFNIVPFNGLDKIEFTLPRGYKDKKGVVHKEGILRLANGFDREIILPLVKKNNATATTMLITRLITFNDGAIVIPDLVGEMSLRDRDYLEKLIKESVFGVDMHIDIVCTSCGAELSGEMGQTNFF